MFLYKSQSLWRFVVLFLLMPTIYSIFGWSIAQVSEAWSTWLREKAPLETLNIFLDEEVAHKIPYGVSLLIILTITLGITIFGKSLIGLLGSCFRSDLTAIVSVLIWSFVLALIICFLNYFAEFLLLLNSVILGRLELRGAGYNNWQTCVILTAICTCSFAIGLLSFDWWESRMSATLSSFLLNFIKNL